MEVSVTRLNQVPIRPKGKSDTYFPFEVTVSSDRDTLIRDIRMISPTFTVLSTDEIRQTPALARKTFYVPDSTPVTVKVTVADGTVSDFRFNIQITDNDQFLYDPNREGPKPVVRKVATRKM